eukprot:TRINITY_DN4405_c0_g1_i4.p1 TRINITY_DN4405_c0_g1~~TRINITY_DN4405_c0_g1_i4.p1  ORF type:complete len:398 (-),score=85.86 TRINITY_DN4405_c0_g1_i4:21-1214(-)
MDEVPQVSSSIRTDNEYHIPIYEPCLSVGSYQLVIENTDERANRNLVFSLSLRSGYSGTLIHDSIKTVIGPSLKSTLDFEVEEGDGFASLEFSTTNRTHMMVKLIQRIERHGLFISDVQEQVVFLLAIGKFDQVTSGLMYEALEEEAFYYNYVSNVEEFLEAHDNATYVRYLREGLKPGRYQHRMVRRAGNANKFLFPKAQVVFYVKNDSFTDFEVKRGAGDTSRLAFNSQDVCVVDQESNDDSIDVLLLDDGATNLTWYAIMDDEFSYDSAGKEGMYQVSPRQKSQRDQGNETEEIQSQLEVYADQLQSLASQMQQQQSFAANSNSSNIEGGGGSLVNQVNQLQEQIRKQWQSLERRNNTNGQSSSRKVTRSHRHVHQLDNQRVQILFEFVSMQHV